MADHLGMLKHGEIWAAIDALARDHGLTASALARKAGLDPTTFNKSKRITREGKPRWPSTESVAKVLEATGAPLAAFVGYIDKLAAGSPSATMPMIAIGQAGEPGRFDANGRPVGDGWDEIPFPIVDDPHAFALEIAGPSLEPFFRDGDILVVSPAATPRRGDRVAVLTVAGDVVIRPLIRRTARRLDLAALGPGLPPLGIAAEDFLWIARILWASQ